MRRGSVFAVSACLALSFAACGTDNSGSGDSSGGQAAQGGDASSRGGGANGGSSAANQGGGAGEGGTPGAGGSAAGTTGGSSSPGSGGASTGGASPANGGSAGSSATGGKANGSGGGGSGGKAANGGSGGKAATGGAGGNGGTASTGGSNATGGARATGGGANVSGGSANSSGGAGGASGNTPVKVWIAGDSTVQNCSSACPCGWGSQFDPLFNSSVTVQNSAVGGRSIQTWLYEANVSSTLTNGECALTADTYNARWTAMLNTTSGMQAGDYLFIQFGINDGDTACPRHVGQALFKKYLGVMAQAAKDHGAQPVFVTPVSAISCNSSGKAVGTRGAFVTTTIDAGTEFNVPVIDLHQRSVDLYNSLGFCPNDGDYSSGIVGAFFCEDHTHFEAAGAVQIAKLVATALREQKIGLAAYLL